MRFINTLREGDVIRSIYLCKNKRSAETRNGKPYDNLVLQDKTGTLDGKVWDPNSGGIADYDEMDFIEVFGEVVSYNNNLQLNIKQLRKPYEDEYNAADYMPTSEKGVDSMYDELLSFVKQIENKYLLSYDIREVILNFHSHIGAIHRIDVDICYAVCVKVDYLLCRKGDSRLTHGIGIIAVTVNDAKKTLGKCAL